MTSQKLESNASHAHLAIAMQGTSSLEECPEGTSSLEQQLRRFWETESIGIVGDSEVELSDKPFPSQIKYDFIQGRYKVGLPWKSTSSESSNYNLCVSRLMKLRARLQGKET